MRGSSSIFWARRELHQALFDFEMTVNLSGVTTRGSTTTTTTTATTMIVRRIAVLLLSHPSGPARYRVEKEDPVRRVFLDSFGRMRFVRRILDRIMFLRCALERFLLPGFWVSALAKLVG